MITRIRKRMKGEKGFTLIELLVVIIIIAILAAIAIPTFLGQRQKAQDAAAKSLVRNAMTAIESTYVDTQNFKLMTEAMLNAVEPSIDWPAAIGTATGPCSAPSSVAANANQVAVAAYDAATVTGAVYEVGTISASGHIFGVKVDKTAGNTFYKTGAGTDGAVGPVTAPGSW